jgi:hypothetical protein
MPLFTIMHIFEIPANNQYEATDELMTARKHNYDKVYLKKVLVRDAEELKPFRHKVNVFAEPKKPAKWGTIFKRQLTGKEWKKEVNHMPKYLVRVAIPTVYVIDAPDEQDAMHQAAERFKQDHDTWLATELQWAEIKGTDATAEWCIVDWG